MIALLDPCTGNAYIQMMYYRRVTVHTVFALFLPIDALIQTGMFLIHRIEISRLQEVRAGHNASEATRVALALPQK
jgi:hypothetical protein